MLKNFYSLLKTKPTKKSFTYEKLCQNTVSVLKGVFQKTSHY